MSGDPEGTEDKDSPLGFDQDEAADFADRVNEQIKDAIAAGDDTDEIEDQYRGATGEDIAAAISRARGELSRDPSDADERVRQINERAKFGMPEGGNIAFKTPDPGSRVRGFDRDRMTDAEAEAQRVLEARELARGRPTAMTMEGNIPLDLQGAIPVVDDPFNLVPEDEEGGAVDVSNIPGVTSVGSPAQQVIQEARGPRAMTMAGVDDLTPDFLPSGMTGRKNIYNVASNVSPVDFEGVDFGGSSLPTAMTMKGVGAAGPSEPYLSEDVINEIEKQAQEPPREEGLGALLSPGGIIKNLVGDLTNRDAAFAREVTRPGNVFQRNDKGDITGVYNPKSNAVFTPESVGIFDIKGQEEAAGDLFRMQRQRRNEDREARNQEDDPTPIIPPLIPESAMTAPQEPVAQTPFVTGANYQPRDPVQYSYTGLPTLAPVSLQPSFRAPQQFSPAYGLSSLRRS